MDNGRCGVSGTPVPAVLPTMIRPSQTTAFFMVHGFLMGNLKNFLAFHLSRDIA